MPIKEIEELIDILEADIPANPESAKSKKLAGNLERDLHNYFKQMETLIPLDRLGQLYNKYVELGIKEVSTPPKKLSEELEKILDSVIDVLKNALLVKVAGHLVNVFIQADKEVISWGVTKAGIPILYEGPPMEQAIKWAQKHGAGLVTKMDEETKRRLANVISSAIKNKRGIPGLARDIRKEFDNMTKYRSTLIAKTETARALRVAGHERMVDMGVTGKEWHLGSGGSEGNCEQCIANAAVGIIPVDQEFPYPESDIHPGCTCSIAPSMLK